MNSLSLTNTRYGTFNELFIVFGTSGTTNVNDVFALKTDVEVLQKLSETTMSKLQTIASDITALTNLELTMYNELGTKASLTQLSTLGNNVYNTCLSDINTLNTSITSNLNINYYNNISTNTLITGLSNIYIKPATLTSTLDNYYTKSYIDTQITNINTNISSDESLINTINNYISTISGTYIDTTELTNNLDNYLLKSSFTSSSLISSTTLTSLSLISDTTISGLSLVNTTTLNTSLTVWNGSIIFG